MHTWLYILQSDDKYYVGITYNLVTRMKNHFRGIGSKCTNKTFHTLAGVYELSTHSKHQFQKENELTLQLASLFGWARVNGGKWTTRQVRPSPSTEKPVACNCGLPAKDYCGTFVCPRVNALYLNCRIPQNVPRPCTFLLSI